MPRALNQANEFKSYGPEKQAYIGVLPVVKQDVEIFAKWCCLRSCHCLALSADSQAERETRESI